MCRLRAEYWREVVEFFARAAESELNHPRFRFHPCRCLRLPHCIDGPLTNLLEHAWSRGFDADKHPCSLHLQTFWFEARVCIFGLWRTYSSCLLWGRQLFSIFLQTSVRKKSESTLNLKAQLFLTREEFCGMTIHILRANEAPPWCIVWISNQSPHPLNLQKLSAVNSGFDASATRSIISTLQ